MLREINASGMNTPIAVIDAPGLNTPSCDRCPMVEYPSDQNHRDEIIQVLIFRNYFVCI